MGVKRMTSIIRRLSCQRVTGVLAVWLQLWSAFATCQVRAANPTSAPEAPAIPSGSSSGDGKVTAPSKPKLPMPPAAQLIDAERTIRSVYAADMTAKKPDDLLALSAKLLQAARDAGNSTSEQYVLLRESANAAANAGDLAAASDSVDSLAELFVIDGQSMKEGLAVMASRAAGAKDPKRAGTFAEEALRLADDAARATDFDAATKMVAIAETAAKCSDDPAVPKAAKARSAEVKTLRSSYLRLTPELEKLRKQPGDPAANAKAGRFFALELGDFGRGLPMLAKGNDAALKALAVKDLTHPADLAERIGLADAWWGWALQEKSAAGGNAKSRAAHWYREGRDGAKGITLAKVDQRIAQADADAPEVLGKAPKPVNVLNLVKLPKDGIAGTWSMTKDGLRSDVGVSRLQLPYEVPAEYDVFIELTVAGSQAIQLIYPRPGDGTYLIFGRSVNRGGLWDLTNNPAAMKSFPTLMNPGDRISLRLNVRNASAAGYFNAEPMFDLKLDWKDCVPKNNSFAMPAPGRLGLFVSRGPVTFHRIEVKEISGPGKVIAE
jgi:hypothetical protein